MNLYYIAIIYFTAATAGATHNIIERIPQESSSVTASNTPSTVASSANPTLNSDSAVPSSQIGTDTTISQGSDTATSSGTFIQNSGISTTSSSIVNTPNTGTISSDKSTTSNTDSSISSVPALLTTTTEPSNSTVTTSLNATPYTSTLSNSAILIVTPGLTTVTSTSSTSTPTETTKPKSNNKTGVAVGIPVLIISIIAMFVGLHFCLRDKRRLGRLTIGGGGGNPFSRTKGYTSGRSRSQRMRTANISRPVPVEEAFSDAPDHDEWELASVNGGRGLETQHSSSGRPFDDSPAATPRFNNAYANPFRDNV